MKLRTLGFHLGKTSTKNMWLKYEFFPKASDPPPLTFGIFEALFSVGLISSFLTLKTS